VPDLHVAQLLLTSTMVFSLAYLLLADGMSFRAAHLRVLDLRVVHLLLISSIVPRLVLLLLTSRISFSRLRSTTASTIRFFLGAIRGSQFDAYCLYG